ncbi:putative nrps-like enzyme protein [Botrytis fragariae]|uniref:Putative nrps-like enzyme protein n=1 Tax=Botrytis fragariae TaxID=1964551 RepID=A0A8H6ECN1_9HELO|nr:putative nrps-like enzyme protein [Botrytis fragariae]KAF5867602.1 putative nrps-like enzyme protein [Botrytis fragariae]
MARTFEGAEPTTSSTKELLPNLVDAIAATEPEAIFAEYPVNLVSYESGYQKFSYGSLANAVNGIAWWLQEKLGPGEDFPTLAYIGPNDIVVNAFLLGAVKTGYKALLISPRNSIRAQENLLNFTKCKTLVTTSPQSTQLQPMIAALSSMGIQILELPNILNLIGKPHENFPFKKTFEAAKDEPFMVLHTSGTTELPKPIVWTHDYIATGTARIEAPTGYVNQMDLYAGVRIFNTFPSFHAAGVFFGLINGISRRSISIYPIAGLPSASLLIDGLKHNNADIAVLVPPYVVDLAQSTESLDFVAKNLNRIFYLGGAIPPAAGDVISSKIELIGHVGATETGLYPSLKPVNTRSNFWGHHQFDTCANISFEHQADDLYEAVWNRNLEPEKLQPIFKTFPTLQQWRSKDLYSPHPTEPDLWLYRGRGDDIIVFLTGEKTNPISMEHRLNQHPEIRQAMIIGTLRFQAALLIELVDQRPMTATERAEIIERIWPAIEDANLTCPAHARVAKSHILFTEPGHPILMSAKGTIQRSPTLREYASEIEKLYVDADRMSAYIAGENDENEEHVDIHDIEAVHKLLRQTVLKVSKWDEVKVRNEDNLFVQGMDSLQALQLIRNLRKALNKPDLAISILYTNPSIVQLLQSIMAMSKDDSNTNTVNASNRRHKIEETLQQYVQLVDRISSEHEFGKKLSPVNEHVVVLTGSTGSLGSCILRTLMQDKSVSHIYCLNRASSAHSRHLENNKKNNESTDFPNSKVTFLKIDLSKADLDLDDETYKRIQNSATDVIHSAWPVNFNLSLETFKPQLDGIINLLSFVSTIPHRVSLLFISSISSILGLESTPIPEAIIDDVSAPLPMGYAESKFISERIFDHAARKLPVDVKIARVGQIAGPAYTFGVWNKSEWMPSLVVTSYNMGFLPENLGSDEMKLDWVPIDILSSSLLDIAFNHESKASDSGARVFHPLNQAPTTWNNLLPIILDTLNSSNPKFTVTTIPYTVWLQKLKDTTRENASSTTELEEMLEKYPAIKLLEFFETLPETKWSDKDVGKSIEASVHLKGLKGIEGAWMKRWVEGWI